MIHGLIVTNFRGAILELPLGSAEDTGIVVSDITGVGPGQADLFVTERASYDGGTYNSSRRGTRNIALLFDFIDTEEGNVEDARLLSYRFFPLQKPVKIEFITDNRRSVIEGIVESNEPIIFSENVTSQISIICPQPYFKDGTDQKYPTEVVFHGIDKKFEFEFTNPVNHKNLLMGELQRLTITNVFYEGDVNAGFKIEIRVENEVQGSNDIYLYNNTLRQEFRLKTANFIVPGGTNGLKKNDQITISSVNGEKYIVLLREGKEYNIFSSMDLDSTWLELTPGDNVIAFDMGENTPNISLKMHYYTLYEGI